MNGLSRKNSMISWFFQLIAAAILAKAAYSKFAGSELSVYVFNALEMGAGGRLLIGVIEGVSVLLLLSSSAPHIGALLGFGTMLGACLAHYSVLGLSVQNDGGAMVLMMVIVMISTSLVMYIRRKNLPLIGHACKP